MTAGQFAALLKAKRIGRGKWIALCPVHREKTPSLNIAEGKRAILVKCFGCGADGKQIAKALGISVSDLFYDKATLQVRARTSLQEQRASLERQLGLVVWLGAVESGPYWEAAEKRIRAELLAVRCRIEPEVVYREWRGRQWALMSQCQKERILEGVWRSLGK